MENTSTLLDLFPALQGLDLPLEELDLTYPIKNSLKHSGVHTLPQLLHLSHLELLQCFSTQSLPCYESVIHQLVRLSEKPYSPLDPSFCPSLTLKRRSAPEKAGLNFFQAAGVWESETIHTRIIAELLNPQSSFHSYGAVFLQKFLEELDRKLSLEECSRASVTTEVRTNEGRYIDMVISTDHFCFPFEVKIQANDLDKQLEHYYDFAAHQGKELPVGICYLTPDGHKPHPKSSGRLTTQQIRLMSFRREILHWLESCMPLVLPHSTDIMEALRQLRENIQRNFSRWRNDVLDLIHQTLSQTYCLPWTECSNTYDTFTLRKDRTGPLEFALRIQKVAEDKIQFFIICGLTQPDEKINYAIAGDYIKNQPQKFQELLSSTFICDGAPLNLNTRPQKSIWNRLPDTCCKKQNENVSDMEFALQCCKQIETIFENLQADALPSLR